MKLDDTNYEINQQQINNFCKQCANNFEANFIQCVGNFIDRLEFWLTNPINDTSNKIIVQFNLASLFTTIKDCHFKIIVSNPTQKVLQFFDKASVFLESSVNQKYIGTFFISETLTPPDQVASKMIDFVKNMLKRLDDVLTAEYEDFKKKRTIK